MRKSLVLIFIAPAIAFAHGDHGNPGAPGFSCEEILEPAPAFDEIQELVVKIFGAPLKLEARKRASEGDRLILREYQNALANWARVESRLPGETKYQKLMRSVVKKALSTYFERLWDNKIKEPDDKARFLKILQAIAKIDPANADFGLFRVQRLVEERYDLAQYADCR